MIKCHDFNPFVFFSATWFLVSFFLHLQLQDYDPYEENPGTAPFSEPETQIMRKLALSFVPHIWVNVHSGMEVSGTMFLVYIPCFWFLTWRLPEIYCVKTSSENILFAKTSSTSSKEPLASYGHTKVRSWKEEAGDSPTFLSLGSTSLAFVNEFLLIIFF